MSLDVLWRTWIGWIVWIATMKQTKDLHILYPNINHSNAVFLQTEYDVPLWDKEGPFFHPNSSLNWLTSVQWKPHERIPADDCQQVSRKLCDTITVSYFWNLPSTDPCYPAGEYQAVYCNKGDASRNFPPQRFHVNMSRLGWVYFCW